jgi:prolyl-tRNA synthetase
MVKETDILTTVESLLQDIQASLLSKARTNLQEKITEVKTYDEFKQVVDDKGGFIKASWCGNPKCEAKIKEETSATIRIIPFKKEEPQTGCIYCGEKGKDLAYFARSY